MAKSSTFIATLKFIDSFTPGFAKAISEAEKQSKTFQNQMRSLSNLGSSLTNLGRNLTLGLTVPIVGLGTKAVKSAMDYEGSLNRIMTLQRKFATNDKNFNLNDPTSISKFREDAKEMITDLSNTYGIAQTDIANSYYLLASAFNDTNNMQEALTTSMKMSVAGNVDSASSAKLLATAYNAYGGSIEKIGDIMASTVMFGFTEFPELAETLGQVILTAAQAGMSLEDLAASMAVITSTGVNTAISTTYLKNALNQMIKSGDRKAFSDDSFLQYLESLKSEMPEIEQQMEKFKNIRARSGVTALLGNTNLYEIYHREISQANGTLNEMYAGIRATSTQNFQVTMVRLNNILEKFGERILPTVNNYLEKFTKWLDGIELTDDDIDKMIGWGKAIATVGPALMLIGTGKKAVAGAASTISIIKNMANAINSVDLAKAGAMGNIGNNLPTTATTTALSNAVPSASAVATSGAGGIVLGGAAIGAAMLTMASKSVDNQWKNNREQFEKYIDEKYVNNPMYAYKPGSNRQSTINKNPDKYIPRNAAGTSRWSGGLTTINENGGEIVDLPTGSRIYPHNQSMKMGGLTINIPKFADTITIRNDSDIDIFAEKFTNKLLKVWVNS